MLRRYPALAFVTAEGSGRGGAGLRLPELLGTGGWGSLGLSKQLSLLLQAVAVGDPGAPGAPAVAQHAVLPDGVEVAAQKGGQG